MSIRLAQCQSSLLFDSDSSYCRIQYKGRGWVWRSEFAMQRQGLLILLLLLLLVSRCRGDIMMDPRTQGRRGHYETLLQERSVQLHYIMEHCTFWSGWLNTCPFVHQQRSARLHNSQQIWSFPAYVTSREWCYREERGRHCIVSYSLCFIISGHLVCAGPPPRTTLYWCTLSPCWSPTSPLTTSRAKSSYPS